MKKLLASITGRLFEIFCWPSPETTEWFCQRAALWWVIQLAPALHLFAVSPSFAGLSSYGSEGHWQLILGGLLAAQTLAVLLGNLWMRVGALFAFCGIWGFIAGMFWASSPHYHWTHSAIIARNTGVGLYASLGADCAIVAIHLVRLWYIDYLSGQGRPSLARSSPKVELKRKARA